MARFKLSSVLLLSAVAATAQVASHAPTVPVKPAMAPTVSAIPVDKPVARVNGTVLSEHDLLRQMMNDFPYARQHGGRLPEGIAAGVRSNALQTIEFEELVYQEALRRGLTVSPARLDRAMTEFKKQFETPAEYQQYLKLEQGGSLQKLRGKVRRAILIDQLLKFEVTRKTAMTDAELRAFYNQHQERFRKPESVSLQTISLAIPDNASPKEKSEVRKRAEDALRQAKAAKNYEEFGLLAEKISQDDWRVMMGDHKTIHRGRMPPQVEQAVFSMPAGQVSNIIETENSFCIARVNTREEAQLIPFDKVRPQLKKDLEGDKAESLRKALEARLRKNAKVEEL